VRRIQLQHHANDPRAVLGVADVRDAATRNLVVEMWSDAEVCRAQVENDPVRRRLEDEWLHVDRAVDGDHELSPSLLRDDADAGDSRAARCLGYRASGG